MSHPQWAKEVFRRMCETGDNVEKAMADLKIKSLTWEELAEIVRAAIVANPKAVGDFKKGKTKAVDAIRGAIMRETKGMGGMDATNEILMSELSQLLGSLE